MRKARDPGGTYLALVLFGVLASLHVSLVAQSQTNDQPPQNQTPFQLSVASNLVVVRVVVRDAQGKPVEGLQKEDFKLFDRGKEQKISQFEEERPIALEAAPTPATPSQPPTAPARAAAAAKRFLVLYFDDLDMSDSDVIDARDAADKYLAKELQPSERVAMFTSSAMLSDFTTDLKQIHDALFRLHPHPQAARHTDCPEISDYQALEISEQDNPNTSDAWRAALDEAVHRCHLPKITDVPTPGAKQTTGDPPAPSDAAPETVAIVRNMARSILAQSEIQARTGLQALERVVNIVASAPGQRSVILVSPGFLSRSEQYQLDRIIDRALHSQVVINSLDPRGLALLMREADVTNGYAPSANSGAVGAQHAIDTNREMVASDVLAEVAEGTGGEYFRNNNDLTAGFRALAGSQGSYILAFAPKDAKRDDKFHALKVQLAEKHKGLALQARRGYFASKEGSLNPEDDRPNLQQRPPNSPALTGESQEQEQIRAAVLSHADRQGLPVEVRTEVSKAADTGELAVLAHLDTRALHFHKDGERNQNTVTFVSVILDSDRKYVTGQQRQAKVDLPDDKLPELLAAGMDVRITFQLKPGNYIIREVVIDSEEHEMTAFSRDVQVR